MKRIVMTRLMLAAIAVHAQPSGAPPGNVSPKDKDTSGKAAGYVGEGGAAGQAGTDPAMLKCTEEKRVKKKHGSDASGKGQRKDWKE